MKNNLILSGLHLSLTDAHKDVVSSKKWRKSLNMKKKSYGLESSWKDP